MEWPAYIYGSTKSFKLMALRNIIVEEDLHLKNANVTMKETFHLVYSKKLKKEET